MFRAAPADSGSYLVDSLPAADNFVRLEPRAALSTCAPQGSDYDQVVVERVIEVKCNSSQINATHTRQR